MEDFAVRKEVLIDPCPICGQSPLRGDGRQYTCASCGTKVEKSRRLGVWSRNRFFFRAIGASYRNAEPDLIGRPFTQAELAELAGTCYSDADLAAIAAGDLSRIRPPSSTVAQILFPQSSETCYLLVNGLLRAQGPVLSDGVDRVHGPVDRRVLRVLDRGNLFISDQRFIFPSDSHTTIRVDRKLTGIRSFTDAFAVQRKGEENATYFLGCKSREAALILAYLQGRLDHLR
jgi:hypothetical protein